MTPSRPYLVRAINEWILDNGMTPYLLVNADRSGVEVPRQYVENGRIVLNIDPVAVEGLRIDNDYIEFNARFQGTPWHIVIPMPAVMAIYARENGQGMMFSEDEYDGPTPPEGPEPEPGGGGRSSRPALKVVK
ncbi:MAG: ClpXP protease specificity-enhancing factor [Gammaproteobacteria bacterium]|nr:MAG: ClpXP protease specificity-enhancing factor [Gammaproteobacteria bacterium]